MDDYEVTIDLEEELSVGVSIDDDLSVLIDFEDDEAIDVNVSMQQEACPIISEINGGDSGPNSQFDIINGFLNGGDADPFN